MSNPERFNPKDSSFKEETIQHHIKRYEFASTFNGSKWLDLCCGYGYGTNLIKEKHSNAEVVGIDLNKDVIKQAQKQYKNCKFYEADITKFGYTIPQDIVIFFEAIEHLSFKNGKKLLKYIYTSSLKKNGYLLLSTPRDIKHNENTFHKSMWTYPILINTLGSIYDEVKILGQDWKTGTISEEDVINKDFYICICRKN